MSTHNEIHLVNSNGTTTGYGSMGGSGGGGGTFTAFIAVSYPDGCDCVCTGVGESYTASDNPYTFTITKKGAYDVTVSKSTYSKTVQKTITTDSQTENVTITSLDVDGSTETANDVQILLYCADIYNKSYTTISQVLADSSSLAQIISSQNAIDYLVRSTTWATDVCSDSGAMGLIGLNNYASNTLLADSTWLNSICNSTYFESVLNVKVPVMTSDTTPSGIVTCSSVYGAFKGYMAFEGSNGRWLSSSKTDQWIAYEWSDKTPSVKLVVVNNAVLPSDGTLPKNMHFDVYSNGSYTTLSNFVMQYTSAYVGSLKQVINNTYYSNKYRLYITDSIDNSKSLLGLLNLQFYGREDV